jgi:hypothetical protein
MRIQIKEDAMCGKAPIPKGEYLVSLQSDSQQINLVAGGKTFKLPATRRRATSKVRTESVTFYSGGGKSWSLVVNTPKHGEWIAMIEYSGTAGSAAPAAPADTPK